MIRTRPIGKAYYQTPEGKRSAELARYKKRGVDMESIRWPRATSCEVCGATNRIALDHDHKTGRFRGWLCLSCNRALGLVNDNPALLRVLATYLEREK